MEWIPAKKAMELLDIDKRTLHRYNEMNLLLTTRVTPRGHLLYNHQHIQQMLYNNRSQPQHEFYSTNAKGYTLCFNKTWVSTVAW